MNRFVSHIEPKVKRPRNPSEDEIRAERGQQRLFSSLCQIAMPCPRWWKVGRKEHQKRAGLLQGCDLLFYSYSYSSFFWGGGGRWRVGVGRLYTRCEEKQGSNSSSFLGNIVVLVRSLFVPLHVVPVDQRLDPLLQVTRLWKRKPRGAGSVCWRQGIGKNKQTNKKKYGLENNHETL